MPLEPTSRRTFVTTTAAFITAQALRVAAQEKEQNVGAVPAPPLTGAAVAGLESFDQLLTSFIQEQRTPGMSLAISRGGKVIYARAGGLADREQQVPVQPDSHFRIASVSKPLTAVAVLQLVERNKLDVDECVLPRLKLELLVDGARFDDRWRRVTVRHCLQHTGGWDRDESFDPIACPQRIARALNTETPVSPEQIIRYMLGRCLDFDPGERFAYSNLGYLLLGRLIEQASGQKYEAYVREHVLAPLGIRRMQLGRALREHQMPGEVCYYDSEELAGRCLYPPQRGERVPICYGAENFEGFAAHGGWVGSAIDLVKFAAAFDDPAKSPLLKEETIRTMWQRPEGAAGKPEDDKHGDYYYSCGWSVRPVGKGRCTAWHDGFIAGSEALLVRRWDGLNWAVLFNTSGEINGKTLIGRIDPLLHQAASQAEFGSS